jgi:peptide/nickel transport system permease protein
MSREPNPSWGNLMMREVATAFAPKNGPFQVVYAGIPLFLSVLAFNFLGDGLRDALDPKLKI